MPSKKPTINETSIDDDGSSKNKKVFWSDDEFNQFVDICVRGTNDGNRRGNGWGEAGWKWIINEMKMIGITKSSDQLKNKWDWMQKQWKIWQKLIGHETGLGWDREKGTIAASNEWWDEKINAAPNFKEKNILMKIRLQGIGEELYQKYCAIFMDTMATGYHRRMPSSINFKVPGLDEVLCEEGSGDSEEETFETMQNVAAVSSFPFSQSFGTSRVEGLNASEGSGRKQKRSENETPANHKKRER